MPVGIEAWVTQIPPITRGWLVLSVLTSLAVQTQLVTPLQLYFSPKSFLNGQPWRAGTTFFYFGPISLDFVFHLFFLYATSLCAVIRLSYSAGSMRYSRMLEESSFPNRRADYFWLLLLSSVMLLALSPLFNLPFLSSSLAFVPIYLWSRRHPSTPISLFGLFTITAPYLPIALVAFSWVLNGTWKAAAGDLVGCAVGHVGWFLRDVWTREMMGGPTVFSEAPVRLKRLFGDE
ncbi:Der1-like protein [Mycena metata]|uniref:Derlin n=1 Tax=Mycena metata TaxID=1033252 RepID=A0AAD7KFK9_9AGAR|nr:Der1-like protein [Mycena metata]